jgi:hypothetical protein
MLSSRVIKISAIKARKHGAASAIACLFVATGNLAHAASLAEATGSVLVNTGAGFQAASLSQNLPTGSRIMARKDSQAKVSYPDFCVVVVNPGQVYTVVEKSPCATGAKVVPGELLPHDYALAAGAVAIGAGVAIARLRAASP